MRLGQHVGDPAEARSERFDAGVSSRIGREMQDRHQDGAENNNNDRAGKRRNESPDEAPEPPATRSQSPPQEIDRMQRLKQDPPAREKT